MIIEYFNENKKTFMAGLAALCVAMMIVSGIFQNGAGFLRQATGFVFVPVMSAFSNTGGWIADRAGAIANIANLEGENTRLSTENEDLMLRLGLLETQVQRLAELERLLNMKDTIYGDFDMMGAYVIARDMGIWYSRPIINKGRNHGVVRNMPVVAGGALLGRVIAVHNNHSLILTIIEDTSSIAVFGGRTGDEGFARGCYTLMLFGLLRLDFVSQDAEFEVGDVIMTSALSSLFPPGLRVGEIVEIRVSQSGDRYAILRPFTDIRNTNAVLILMDLFEFVKE